MDPRPTQLPPVFAREVQSVSGHEGADDDDCGTERLGPAEWLLQDHHPRQGREDGNHVRHKGRRGGTGVTDDGEGHHVGEAGPRGAERDHAQHDAGWQGCRNLRDQRSDGGSLDRAAQQLTAGQSEWFRSPAEVPAG